MRHFTQFLWTGFNVVFQRWQVSYQKTDKGKWDKVMDIPTPFRVQMNWIEISLSSIC